MAVYGAGINAVNQLACKSDGVSTDDYSIITNLVKLPFSTYNLEYFSSAGSQTHFVYSDGNVFAVGYDKNYGIGLGKQDVIKFPQMINFPETIIMVVAGDGYSLYLTDTGSLIMCCKHKKGERIYFNNLIPITMLFSFISYPAAIDINGGIYVFDSSQLDKSPIHYTFDIPIVDIACAHNILFVLDENGIVHQGTGVIPINISFKQEVSLINEKIIQISGCNRCTLALSKSGRVYSFGDNRYGQLGAGNTVDDFTKFQPVIFFDSRPAKQVIGGILHSLVLTRDGTIWGFGNNRYGQLMLGFVSEKELVPRITSVPIPASFVTANANYSLAYVGNYVQSYNLLLPDIVSEKEKSVSGLSYSCVC